MNLGVRVSAMLALGWGLCLAAPEVSAQSSNTDVVLAETLYRQGRQLMEDKKYDEACAKFAESYRLDAATGTLLNLAACNEARGRTATAWLQYNDALLAARRDGREDRVSFARERIAAIEPDLSRLAVNLAPDASLDGLEIRLDGALLGTAALGVPAPVDPGEHRVEATAPGKKTWTKTVKVGKVADSQEVVVPLLIDDPNAKVVDSGSIIGPTPQPGGTPPTADRPVMERPVPTAVYVAGGATVLLAIGTGVTSAIYLDKRASYTEANADANATTSEREAARDSARNWGVINGGLLVGTVVGAALTSYLYFTRPEVEQRARVTPWLAPRAGGVSVSGVLF